MNNADRLYHHLKDSGADLCDDCLSSLLNITTRQQVNQICRRMADVGTINRMNGFCAGCRRVKIVNAISGATPRSTGPSRSVKGPNIIDIDAPSRSAKLPDIIDIGAPACPTPPQTSSLPPPQRAQPVAAGGGVEVSPAEFEVRVGRYLERTFNQPFGQRILSLGHGQGHAVDQVSADGKILVECKSYTWTSGGNMPSGKIATLREAVFLLKSCPGERRILVMQRRPFPGRELLVDYFCRLNRGLLDGIEVWDFIVGRQPEDDRVRVVAGGQQ